MHGPTGIFWANLTPFSLQCYVACDDGACTGHAPVRWHFKQNTLPPVSQQDCPKSDW
jgi:hypothetical protein